VRRTSVMAVNERGLALRGRKKKPSPQQSREKERPLAKLASKKGKKMTKKDASLGGGAQNVSSMKKFQSAGHDGKMYRSVSKKEGHMTSKHASASRGRNANQRRS